MAWLFILPMRNGNPLGSPGYSKRSPPTFYPTYEEWKPNESYNNIILFSSFLSYLWGMETYIRKFEKAKRVAFYPTYEEWKRHFLFTFAIEKAFYFLSYLWGMETMEEATEFTMQDFFLSYLWGMETLRCICILPRLLRFGFLSYL